jgi:hypothetical protein
MAEEDVNVKFGADTAALTQATGKVKEELNSLNAVTAQLTGVFGQLGSATALLGGILTTLGLSSFVRDVTEGATDAIKLATALGITGAQFLDLKAAAALSGTSVEALGLSLERMSLLVQRSTRDAFTPQAQALKVLGLNAKELIGLSADQYFLKISEAVSHFNPSLNLTNALMVIGGRSMANMVSAFTQGTEEVKRFQEEMARTKVGQEGFFAAAITTHHEILIMDSAINGLNKQLFLSLKPTLDIIIKTTREFAISVRESIKEGGDWSVVLQGISALLKSIVTTTTLLAAVVEGFVSIMKNSWTAILTGGVSTMDGIREAARKMSDDLGSIIKETGAKIGAIWATTERTRHERSAREDAEAMDEMGRKRLEVTMAQIDGQTKVIESGFERQSLLYQRDVDNLKITEAQKVVLVGAASQQRYAAEITLLQQKLQLGGIDIAQRAQIENQITELTLRAANERIKVEIDAAKAVQQQWSFMESALTSSFSTALRGLLAGTTSWKNAMKGIFADVVTAAIQEFAKLAIIKPMMNALSDAFAPATFFADILKVIAKLIGQVFAGATAFFAPTLGPAAPAAGAAVAAATEGTALGFEQGAWSVPSTANALVHRDEMILPVDFASAVRSALTGGAMGGSSNLNLSIQAWDGASVARWLRSGGSDMLARAISMQFNQNPTVRPRY